MNGELSGQETLSLIDQAVKKEFDHNRSILSFDEYLLLLSQNPDSQMRGSARYLADMMDHYGKSPSTLGDGLVRFHVFDQPVNGLAPKIVGQEAAQTQTYRALRAFNRQGINNKLILLHGPNGSAKSSIIHALMTGLERYSREKSGSVYSFNWIFPVERYTKGGIGLGNYATARDAGAPKNFSKLPDEEVAARIPCELKDHPVLLVPERQRYEFLEKLIGSQKAKAAWNSMPQYLTKGDLCHRCRQISDALLAANDGDFKKVLSHIQVERFYFSRRYRKGLVTISPQLHVDAEYHQLTYNKSLSSLPASLQGLNLFVVGGDLVDGNRGIVEYSDLLKRPVDSFKYLLTACETGAINLGASIAYLDTVLLGSTNEVQLDAFKEFPDFTSFKARIELVRVPYLLSIHEEQEIYSHQLEAITGDKHVAPHVSWTVSFWAVLTRLKKPNSINYPPNVSTLISNLSPLEKARFYDTGDPPATLAPEDRKLLRSVLRKLREEYSNIPYYEGRMGASAREIRSILFDAAQNPEYKCLSPLAVFHELEAFVKKVTEYEFLKQDVKEGFHDATEFINITRNEYIQRIDREVRDSMGLYDSAQWEEFLKRYVSQISLVLKKEKSKNPITGKLEDPDFALISEFEKIAEAPQESPAREAFRQNIIAQVGAWSLDHAGMPVVYAKVFPDLWSKLEKHYFESQKALLTKMSDALLVYGTEADDPDSEGAILARKTIQSMVKNRHYCELCAKEVITFLMRQRY